MAEFICTKCGGVRGERATATLSAHVCDCKDPQLVEVILAPSLEERVVALEKRLDKVVCALNDAELPIRLVD